MGILIGWITLYKLEALKFLLLFFHRTALGDACNGDTVFADSLEEFGGGTDDPVSVSIGGCLLFFFLYSTFSLEYHLLSETIACGKWSKIWLNINGKVVLEYWVSPWWMVWPNLAWKIQSWIPIFPNVRKSSIYLEVYIVGVASKWSLQSWHVL